MKMLALPFLLVSNFAIAGDYICQSRKGSLVEFKSTIDSVEIITLRDYDEIASKMPYEGMSFDGIYRFHIGNTVKTEKYYSGRTHSEDIADWRFEFNRKTKVFKYKSRTFSLPYITIFKATCKTK